MTAAIVKRAAKSLLGSSRNTILYWSVTRYDDIMDGGIQAAAMLRRLHVAMVGRAKMRR